MALVADERETASSLLIPPFAVEGAAAPVVASFNADLGIARILPVVYLAVRRSARRTAPVRQSVLRRWKVAIRVAPVSRALAPYFPIPDQHADLDVYACVMQVRPVDRSCQLQFGAARLFGDQSGNAAKQRAMPLPFFHVGRSYHTIASTPLISDASIRSLLTPVARIPAPSRPNVNR